MRTTPDLGLYAIRQQIPCPVQKNGEPLVFTKSFGAKLYDANGKDYIDLQNGKGSILLGHNDPAVNQSLINFLSNNQDVKSGFHPLVYEVAQKILNNLHYEAIAFFKTGTEAVSAAVTAARRKTKKHFVLSSGYHGYSPFWERSDKVFYPNKSGVIDFYYNLNALKKLIVEHKKDIAAIVISPDRLHFQEDWFQKALDVIKESDIFLISDEVKAGYRYHPGLMVAQFGWDPDLAIVSKGIANGYPLSAVVGSSDCIDEIRDHSYTSFFDPLSFVVANVVLDTLQDLSVYTKLEQSTHLLTDKIKKVFQKYNLPIEIIQYKSFFQFVFGNKDFENKFYHYSIDEGIIFYTKDNQVLSLAFSEKIIEELIEKIDNVARNLSRDFKNKVLNTPQDNHYVEAAWYLIDGLPGGTLPYESAQKKVLDLSELSYV